MIYAFTRRAERALTLNAQKEARRLNSVRIEPEHVVYAVINESGGAAKAALDFLQIDVLLWKRELEAVLLTYEKQDDSIDGNFSNVEVPASQRTKDLLKIALQESLIMGHKHVGTEHLLLAACSQESSHAAAFFARQKADVNLLRFMVQTSFNHTKQDDGGGFPQFHNLYSGLSASVMEAGARNPVLELFRDKPAHSKTPHLDSFCVDLSALAKQGVLDPVIGREKEIERALRILCRRVKNNPIFTGEPGTGKTALVEGLAQYIAGKNAPSALAGKRILSLNIGSIVAGTEYRGQFEQRIKSIITECEQDANVILFIDEIHTIVGAGRGSGALDAGNMLKPALSRGTFQCIGATTLAEYRKYFERDGALERRFQMVEVCEPDVGEVCRILSGLKGRYEEFHGVRFTDAAVNLSARLADRFIYGRSMPDKAIDLLDETAVMKKLESEKSFRKTGRREMPLIDADDVSTALSQMTGVPQDGFCKDGFPVLDMARAVKKTLIGQDEAVERLCKAVIRSRSGLSAKDRPQGSFLFLGCSGSGKTLLAKTLAQILYGSKNALLRIDMSDFSEKHTVSRLTGAAPGYVGYEEGGVLTERLRRNPNCVVLLDEAEKAHGDVFNLFLQALEEGEIEDNFGRKVSLRQSVIIMTSNAGMDDLVKKQRLGFTGAGETLDYKTVEKAALKAARSFFKTEFLNRIDEIIVFKPFTEEAAAQILALELDDLRGRLDYALDKNGKETGFFTLEISEKAKNAVLSYANWQKNGAREIRRAVKEKIEDVLAVYLLQNQNAPQSVICVNADENGVVQIEVKKKARLFLRSLINSMFVFCLAVAPVSAAFLGCATGAISAEEYYSIGMAYFDIGKYSEAETWLLRASSANRTMRASEYNLGRIAFEQGRFTEAAKYFERILKGDAKNVMALKALAFTLIKLGDLEKAEKIYQKTLELDPESADEGYNYSLVLFALEKYAECEAVLQKYNFNLTENKDTLLMLARAQKAQKKVEALDAYDIWLKKHKDAQVRREYAEMLEENGFLARALEQLKSALSEFSGNEKNIKKPDLQFDYARLLLIADPENPEALKEFEAAIAEGFNNEEAVKKLIADPALSKANKDAVQRLLDAGLQPPQPETEAPVEEKPAEAETPPSVEEAAPPSS
ncbi:MAG: AAA family ATPase [Spirochaetaceae bacterium]|jgi:ATP-dependent Clp protease ATP-binding subunit ClpC|nr:AAA family ATPase [Spirochaetaceae bacterium]